MDESTVSIDLSMVNSEEELHNLLKEKLDFPDFYGKNWAAFWDAITGLVELPKKLEFTGWREFSKNLPAESWTLKKSMKMFNKKYPEWGCEVIYKK